MTDDRDDQEFSPGTRRRSHSWVIPIITVVVVAAAVIVGLMIQAELEATDQAPAPPDELPPADEIYNRHCASCHGDDGTSTSPRFPPLVDTDWVVGDEQRLILLTLHGLRGPIEVRGRTYDEPMPGFGTRLSDAEIAAILSYIRTSWGHDADEIDPQDVADARQLYPADRGPWTAEQLEALQGD